MTKAPSDWQFACRVDDVPPRQGRFIKLGALEVALLRPDNEPSFVCVQNSCPHAGANLSAGHISDGKLTCPWHQWEFHIPSGICVHNESIGLRRYETRVQNGDVLIRVTPMSPPDAHTDT